MKSNKKNVFMMLGVLCSVLIIVFVISKLSGGKFFSYQRPWSVDEKLRVALEERYLITEEQAKGFNEYLDELLAEYVKHDDFTESGYELELYSKYKSILDDYSGYVFVSPTIIEDKSRTLDLMIKTKFENELVSKVKGMLIRRALDMEDGKLKELTPHQRTLIIKSGIHEYDVDMYVEEVINVLLGWTNTKQVKSTLEGGFVLKNIDDYYYNPCNSLQTLRYHGVEFNRTEEDLYLWQVVDIVKADFTLSDMKRKNFCLRVAAEIVFGEEINVNIDFSHMAYGFGPYMIPYGGEFAELKHFREYNNYRVVSRDSFKALSDNLVSAYYNSKKDIMKAISEREDATYMVVMMNVPDFYKSDDEKAGNKTLNPFDERIADDFTHMYEVITALELLGAYSVEDIGRYRSDLNKIFEKNRQSLKNIEIMLNNMEADTWALGVVIAALAITGGTELIFGLATVNKLYFAKQALNMALFMVGLGLSQSAILGAIDCWWFDKDYVTFINGVVEGTFNSFPQAAFVAWIPEFTLVASAGLSLASAGIDALENLGSIIAKLKGIESITARTMEFFKHILTVYKAFYAPAYRVTNAAVGLYFLTSIGQSGVGNTLGCIEKIEYAKFYSDKYKETHDERYLQQSMDNFGIALEYGVQAAVDVTFFSFMAYKFYGNDRVVKNYQENKLKVLKDPDEANRITRTVEERYSKDRKTKIIRLTLKNNRTGQVDVKEFEVPAEEVRNPSYNKKFESDYRVPCLL